MNSGTQENIFHEVGTGRILTVPPQLPLAPNGARNLFRQLLSSAAEAE